MPIITISTYSDRTQREKDRLAEAITDNVVKIFGIGNNEVIIVFHEEPHGHWYAEGTRRRIRR
jgi:4-oxalocrotonate tautomerase